MDDACPKHREPWLPGVAPGDYRRCTFYIPEFGVSEDYGCPQPYTDHESEETQ